jgi:hypothetical protein
MKRLLFTAVVMAVATTFISVAQQRPVELKQEIVGNDTFFIASTLKRIDIISKKHFSSSKEESDFNRLRRNVMIVYPYAKMAGAIYAQLKDDLETIGKKRKQNKYLRQKEDELRERFEDKLKDLTVTQGAILVKLINRETGNNCYDLIKELKSPAAAFFWNVWAKKYDYNLKEPYKPEDNPDLELIVKALEEMDEMELEY